MKNYLSVIPIIINKDETIYEIISRDRCKIKLGEKCSQ